MSNLVLHKIQLESSMEKNIAALIAVKKGPNHFDLNKILPIENQYNPTEAMFYWGVKGNSRETAVRNNCVFFETANESPTKLIALFAAQHQLDMTVYVQEEFCNFWHKHTYKNGILVEMSGGVVDQLMVQSTHAKAQASLNEVNENINEYLTILCD
jgi:hypothetical protein